MLSVTSKKSPGAATALSRRLRAGKVYRREELSFASNAIDRHLQQLQETGRLKKLSPGLYYVPRQSVYGNLPPDDKELVGAFLRDNDFLLFSPASYNSLGLGGTQLYNRTLVYNHKRHGQFQLGNRTFDFRMKHRFPRKLSPEFLFVDLLNNADELTEEREQLLQNAKSKIKNFNRHKLVQAASNFGTVATNKLMKGWLNEGVSAQQI
jgi:hypothetical protein